MKQIILFLFLAIRLTSELLCNACQGTVKASAKLTQLLVPKFIAVDVLQSLCMRRYDSEKLCKRVGKEIAPLAIDNFIQNHISSDKICSGLCNGTFVKYYADKQESRILAGLPQKSLNLSKYLSVKHYTVTEKDHLNILHISDIHLDKNYTQNSSVNCDLPICCHSDNGFPENPSAQAKPYGSKSCDSPPKLFDSFMDFVKQYSDKQRQGIDVLIATGDFVAHNEWEKTNQGINQIEKQVEEKIRQTFPKSILLKSQGNNDFLPDHQYKPQSNPSLIELSTISTGSTTLTFLSLNTIAFDQMNLYLLGDQSYAIFQLMILQDILSKDQYQNVYLLGHIPTTLDGTVGEYAKVFRALVTRYSSKIKGQFYGHVHSDQLTINTDPRDDKPTGFAFVAPSISPLHVGSSRARVYKLLTGKQNGVTNYVQFRIKDFISSQWLIDYQFRRKYNLPSEQTPITPSQANDIKTKILSDKKQIAKYLQTTGLEPEFGQKAHCNMIDDPEKRRSCQGNFRSDGFGDKIYRILDILRGQWGYYKKEL